MYTIKSFHTHPYNQKHETNFIKYFPGSYLKRFPNCIQKHDQLIESTMTFVTRITYQLIQERASGLRGIVKLYHS